MMKRNIMATLFSTCTALAFAVPASADINPTFPGSECTFYSTPTNTQLTQSGRTAQLHNTSASTAKIQCSMPDRGPNLQSWFAVVDNVAAWTVTSCNLYWTNQADTVEGAYPSAAVSLRPFGSKLTYDATGGGIPSPGGGVVLGCTMPPNSTIYNYRYTQF